MGRVKDGTAVGLWMGWEGAAVGSRMGLALGLIDGAMAQSLLRVESEGIKVRE